MPTKKKHSSLTIRNGIRRVESGEYEEHDNQKVFVVRGFFEHITNDVSVTISHNFCQRIPIEFQTFLQCMNKKKSNFHFFTNNTRE